MDYEGKIAYVMSLIRTYPEDRDLIGVAVFAAEMQEMRTEIKAQLQTVIDGLWSSTESISDQVERLGNLLAGKDESELYRLTLGITELSKRLSCSEPSILMGILDEMRKFPLLRMAVPKPGQIVTPP